MQSTKFTLLFSALFLGACQGNITDADRALPQDELNIMNDADTAEIMLNLADPERAVAFFRNAVAQEPDRIDLKRGLALSLAKAGKHAEAVLIYETMAELDSLTNEDRVAMADAYIRNGAWDEGEAQLDAIPPTFETFKRYRLEAIVADYNKEWNKADSFYDIARGLTVTPASTLNNWGFSKQSRGDLENAEKLYRQALRADPSLFAAKTNLVIVRAQRREYNLPVVPMTDEERAILLYYAAREAVKLEDRDIARGLLERAIDTHPRYFAAAVDALRALNANQSL